MRGGARPGAGRKRTRPLTLTEIGKRLEAYLKTEIRGRWLAVWLPSGEGPLLPLGYTKGQALVLLKRLEARAKT
ncbi:hypothetical protein UFOVP1122_25 [uncultured Caudovirales phage]|uniref:Uncharacterized protein n=1 Tax=uncultured Caudovirales phage TaxID=2100421 RepID=A0A6J5QQ56_9CAUD|nr:hypothetical protein UFOVP1122_25 [uncultured Caudovirales phage]